MDDPRRGTPPPPTRPAARAGLGVVALAALALAAAPLLAQAAPVTSASRFDTGAGGWTAPDPTPPAAGLAAEAGRIEAADVDPWTAYSAPAAFLGGLGADAGGPIGIGPGDVDLDDDAGRLSTLLLHSGADDPARLGAAPATSLSPLPAVPARPPQWLAGLMASEALAPAAAADFARMLGGVEADWASDHVDPARHDDAVLAAAAPGPGRATLLGVAALLVLAGIAASARAGRRRARRDGREDRKRRSTRHRGSSRRSQAESAAPAAPVSPETRSRRSSRPDVPAPATPTTTAAAAAPRRGRSGRR